MNKTAILGLLGALSIAGAAFAQDAAPAAPPPPAEAPRCGGLLCDFGLAGKSGTSLPCNDFVCHVLTGERAEAAPPPPPEAAPAPIETAPVKKVHKKKRVAKLAAPKPAPAAAAPN